MLTAAISGDEKILLEPLIISCFRSCTPGGDCGQFGDTFGNKFLSHFVIENALSTMSGGFLFTYFVIENVLSAMSGGDGNFWKVV